MAIVKTEPEIPATIDVSAEKEIAEITSEAKEIATIAGAFPIRNSEDYESAGAERRSIGKKIAEYDKKRAFMKAPSLEACRRIDEFFSVPIGILTTAKENLDKLMKAYLSTVEEKQKEEEAARKKEIERLGRVEEKAEARGDDFKASIVRAEAGAVAAAPLSSTAPKVSGISTPKIRKYKVIDIKDLLRAAADGKVAFKIANEKEAVLNGTVGSVEVKIEVGQLLKALGERFALPGVAAYEEHQIRTTGR